MVLGYDRPVIYSEDHMTDTYMADTMHIKTEERDCRDSPFTHSFMPDMGAHTNGSTTCRKINNRSPFSRFCPSPAGTQDSKMAVMKKLLVDEIDNNHFTSWITMHPQNWTKKEVLDWVFYVAEQENLDGARVKAEAYQTFTGADLIKMSREDFVASDPLYGLKMYQTFRNLVNDVIFEKPRPVPYSSTLGTFNQFNHCHVTNLTRKICQEVFGEPGGRAVNDPISTGSTRGTSEGSNQGSYSSNNFWCPDERVKHINGQFGPDRESDCKSNNVMNNTEDSNDLVIHEMDNDVKVDVPNLGTYSIGTEFSMTFSALASSPTTAASKLYQANSFTAPLSPVSPSTLPQFDALSPDGFSPLPYGASSSSPACSDSMSPWFSQSSKFSLPSSSVEVFPPPTSSSSLRRHPSNLNSNYKNTHSSSQNTSLLPVSSPSSSSSSYGILPMVVSENFMSDSPLSSSSSSSYHVEKKTTTTTTLCKRNNAFVGPACQKTKSETFSTSWTYSASLSSSLKQREHHLSSSRATSSSSQSTCRGSMDSTYQEDPLSSHLLTDDHAEDVFLACGLDEEDMEYGMNEVSDMKKKTPRKNRNNTAKTGNHLWEFVRDLLHDPKTNPRLLKWEDKENGVFRFVQSEQVARLWGEKKNNPLMTYEKLSRAMRFCRKAGYFHQVPKTGKFPKKLCFMFGEKAHGWKD